MTSWLHYLPWLAFRLPPADGIPIVQHPSRFAMEVLRVARGEIGHGEADRNNEGPRLDVYRRGGPKGAWCAAFVSWCLEQAAENLSLVCPVKRSHGARRLFKNCCAVGEVVELPMPGDIGLQSRGAAGSWTGHVYIVSRALSQGTFAAIEGNRGTYPSMVDEFKRAVGEPNHVGWCRLP